MRNATWVLEFVLNAKRPSLTYHLLRPVSVHQVKVKLMAFVQMLLLLLFVLMGNSTMEAAPVSPVVTTAVTVKTIRESAKLVALENCQTWQLPLRTVSRTAQIQLDQKTPRLLA